MLFTLIPYVFGLHFKLLLNNFILNKMQISFKSFEDFPNGYFEVFPNGFKTKQF